VADFYYHVAEFYYHVADFHYLRPSLQIVALQILWEVGKPFDVGADGDLVTRLEMLAVHYRMFAVGLVAALGGVVALGAVDVHVVVALGAVGVVVENCV
jgi:hypothetical protein